MAELVDAPDSKSGAFGRSGSTPDIPTNDSNMEIKNNKLRVQKLKYLEPTDVIKKFETFTNQILLDSAGEFSKDNRYTYLAVDPLCIYKLKKNKLYENDKLIKISKKRFLNNLINKTKHNKRKYLPDFQCGLAGYITYDTCLNIEKIKQISKKDDTAFDSIFGLYDFVFAFDLKLKKSYLFSLNLDHLKLNKNESSHINRRNKLLSIYKVPYISATRSIEHKDSWKPEITKQNYIMNIKKIISYINQGDIFQTNYTHKFFSNNKRNLTSLEIYLNYRDKTATPFSAFLNFDDLTVCSYSPERLIKLQDDEITTSPIKGTIKRGNNEQQDRDLKSYLQNSKKNLAENLMIVDVLRNDISRVSKRGSVKVTELAKIKSYKNVHHLVSTIKSYIKKELNILDLLLSILPGGSITGAPKIRAMEIISELENSKRGVYCGAIGYISFNGNADFNIPIRTMTIKNNYLTIGCGGGIVSDSLPYDEYNESIQKISNIIKKKINKKTNEHKHVLAN